MVQKGPTNPNLNMLIDTLNKEKKPLWRRLSQFLSGPTRNRAEINLSKIDRYTIENETIVVPGKVLGSGTLTKAVSVAAWNFSESARSKITACKGKCMSIEELLKKNPTGKGVRVMVG